MSTARPLVVVVGLARSGVACARVLAAEGYAVRVVDRAGGEAQRGFAAQLPPGVDVALGPYPDDVAAGAAMICPAPAVPWDAPELEWARGHGIAVRSEMDLVFERCPAPIVGITGTNGKTTTTALAGAVLAAGGLSVHVGGNIGVTMLDRLGDVRPGDWVVLELSSFQLESAAAPRCRIATVLNVTPDHLDRHGTLEAYVAAKQRLVRAADPQGTVVLNDDDPVTRAMGEAADAPVRWFGTGRRSGEDGAWADGAWVEEGVVVTVEAGAASPVLRRDEIPLFGDHNVLNVLAAVNIGRAAGVAAAYIGDAVRAFRPVPHRLEPVLDEGGILWINDTKATNLDAARVALRAFGDRPMIWLGGGKSKGVGPDDLVAEVAARARHSVVYGATGPELAAAFARRHRAACTLVATLEEAVAVSRRIAQTGDVVLLAPGYTSWDQFSSYEERGRLFADLVKNSTPSRTR